MRGGDATADSFPFPRERDAGDLLYRLESATTSRGGKSFSCNGNDPDSKTCPRTHQGGDEQEPFELCVQIGPNDVRGHSHTAVECKQDKIREKSNGRYICSIVIVYKDICSSNVLEYKCEVHQYFHSKFIFPQLLKVQKKSTF